MEAVAQWLFDPSGLTPHGFRLSWEPWLIWTHVLSTIAIGIAYFAIPMALAHFARRRRDLMFRPVLLLFAAFILLCGTGHWVKLLTLWFPLYGVEGIVMAATGLVSVATAVALWPLLPQALTLPSPVQMREVNAALRESEARHRTAFLGAPVAMHILDTEGRIVEVSERWLDLLGFTREEVVGRRICELQEAESAARIAPDWLRLLDQGEIRDVERRFLRRNGEVLDVLVSARIERQGEAWCIVAALTDVTDRKRTEMALRASEERLRHAQKMEAIGQLTGGVAHDFNNVLQAVTGNLELIRHRVGQDRPDVARLASNALDATSKATGLTSQLLSFARRQRLDPQPLDPAEVAEGMRALLRRTLGERIELRVQTHEAVGACLADRNQLESALLNLAINARDAILSSTGRGVVTLSVRAERVGPAAEGWPPEGEYIRLAVRDDGPGMPDEVRRRAFEPFFTTKAPGKGTGLGLAQIHGFAHQSGGTALIESTPGQGTEVAILLPRSSEPAQLTTGPSMSFQEAEPGFGETVLVVEDDPMVRRALAETLRDLRYRVTEAADADAALTMLDTGTVPAAVLSDVMMPGSMDGVEFAEAVRRRLPGMPVVLATGRPAASRERLLPRGVALLHKPLSRNAIATALRQAFDTAMAEPVEG